MLQTIYSDHYLDIRIFAKNVDNIVRGNPILSGDNSTIDESAVSRKHGLSWWFKKCALIKKTRIFDAGLSHSGSLIAPAIPPRGAAPAWGVPVRPCGSGLHSKARRPAG